MYEKRRYGIATNNYNDIIELTKNKSKIGKIKIDKMYCTSYAYYDDLSSKVQTQDILQL
ncbi:MAG: hypothetical protein ACK5HL_04395 [Bacilli bacterium]